MKSDDKLINFFENFTREKYFTDRVYQIRKELGIPRNGIKFPKKLPKLGLITLPASALGISYKEKKMVSGALQAIRPYGELIIHLPGVYKNHETLWFINVYILYNERKFEIFDVIDKCKAVELIKLRMEYSEMEGCCDCELKVTEKYLDYESNRYPIVIGVSPFATQNEVVDLVKKRWDEIQASFMKLEKDGWIAPFQEEKEEIKKIRTRKQSSKQVEDIIYTNKGLSLNKLRNLIDKELDVSLDPGEIGKLRSLAIKRRENMK